MSIFSSFSVNFPPHFIPSCQLTVSMHQIGSLICDQHNKLMVRMTILFLLCTYTIIMHQHLQRKSLATHYIDGKSEMEEWLQWRSAMEPIHWKKWKSRRVQQT